MIVRKEIDLDAPLTEEQLAMLEKLSKMTDDDIVYDEDCPPLTDEQLKQFKRVSEVKRQERLKQTVSIRLSPRALKKAKSLGKGYTSVLSRILESALEDNELIEKFL